MKYTFFWNGPFSNWHPSNFTYHEYTYNCAEQYMMHAKALYFGDLETAKKILQEDSPREQKALGRQVSNFKAEEWSEVCESIVYVGLKAKFEQNPDLLKKLKETGDTLLVEASPFDRIWGIGYDSKNALDNIDNWGKNLLGKLLTQLRKDLTN